MSRVAISEQLRAISDDPAVDNPFRALTSRAAAELDRLTLALASAEAPRIVAAAVRYLDPVSRAVVTVSMPRPARHGTIMRPVAGLGFNQHEYEQGFLTSEGLFVDRTRALVIARAARQLLPVKSGTPDSPELFSEDVW